MILVITTQILRIYLIFLLEYLSKQIKQQFQLYLKYQTKKQGMTDFFNKEIEFLPIHNIWHKPAVQGQKTKRKKAINFLKEEMSNIREGMSRILKVKSEKDLRKLDLCTSKTSLQSSRTNITGSSPESVQIFNQHFKYEIMELRKRVGFLQKQNGELLQKLKHTQNQKAIQIKNLEQQKKQLQIHNEALYIQINKLAQEVQILAQQIRQFKAEEAKKNKKLQKKSKSRQEFVMNPELLGVMNPELLGLDQILTELEKYKKQNSRLKQQIKLMQNEIQIKFMTHAHQQNIIEELNNKIMCFNINKYDQKYKNKLSLEDMQNRHLQRCRQ